MRPFGRTQVPQVFEALYVVYCEHDIPHLRDIAAHTLMRHFHAQPLETVRKPAACSGFLAVEEKDMTMRTNLKRSALVMGVALMLGGCGGGGGSDPVTGGA